MKKIFLLLLFTTSFILGFSQSFMHGAGVGVFVTKEPNNDALGFGTLTYSPRVNFVETEAFSVSLGIPLSVGFSGDYSYQSSTGFGAIESNTLEFMFNAPAIINLNVGAGSTKENEQRFGFFVGAGFGYHYGPYTKENTDLGFISYDDKYGSSYGPAGNLGVRFGVGRHQKNIEARLSYMKAISNSKTSVFGIAALFNF